MKVTKITKIVAYYRLSKPKKGKTKNETIRDAYGLEDQRREVARIAAEYDAQCRHLDRGDHRHNRNRMHDPPVR